MKKEVLKPKLFSVMKDYTPQQFGRDVISGIIVAIIALPLSIALALASGVGPEKGIYTAIIAGFLISFLGGSRVQIAGPTAAFATIVAGIVAKNGMDGLIISTVIAGVFLILMGVFRLGNLIRFIPFTITTGFTAGIAVTILIGQLKDFFGLSYPEGTPNIETIDKIKAFALNIGSRNLWALAIGIGALLILVFWPKKWTYVPASLVAVIAGAAVVKIFKLPVSTIGFKADGSVNYTISAALPTLHLPKITFESLREGLSDGFTIAILAAIESLLSAVVADSMIGSKHRSNTELVAQGVGNIGSVLFGGIPATGAIARTAANIKNGGRTPVAGMVHSVVLLVVLLLLMPYAALIPMPVIAAILFQVAYNMSGWRTFVRLVKTAPRADVLVLMATFILTVVFDLVVAIEVGMIGACVLFMKQMSDESQVRGWKYYTDENDPESIEMREIDRRIRVYEITGPLFFGAVDRMSDISLMDFTKVLIIRMRGVPAIDATAMRSLEQLQEKCEAAGVKLVMSHVNEQPMKAMKRSRLYDKIGGENFCPKIDSALERAQELLGD